MLATYNMWLVVFAVVVATAVSYTSLRLASRVAAGERGHDRLWPMFGTVAMGIGISLMHAIGMMGYSVRITLRYDI